MGKWFPMLFGRAKAKPTSEIGAFVACSVCFTDQGLSLDAGYIGAEDSSACANCGKTTGRKLTREHLGRLAHRFFVWGTLHRFEYGAAPLVQFNEHQKTSIDASAWFEADLQLISNLLGVGFFYYGPRFWMFGEVEPLKALQDPATRDEVINRILSEYPQSEISPDQIVYRVRRSPKKPEDFNEYDSPPTAMTGSGRLDSIGFPVMYCSQDLQVCIHECRVTAEDDLFVATLAPTKNLKVLDLAELLEERQDVTEFDSLDMAVHMLFLAGGHSYEIARAIARSAKASGFDGLIYPSYFSMLRTGAMPFETVFGISHRRVSHFKEREKSKIIRNLALFGRPIEEGSIRVKCIDRLILSRVKYKVHFGPVGCKPFAEEEPETEAIQAN
jgi:RES domain